jgi:hypothetical protein
MEIPGVNREEWEKWSSHDWGYYDAYQRNSKQNEFRVDDKEAYEQGLTDGSSELMQDMDGWEAIAEEQSMRDSAMSRYTSELDEARNPDKYT